MPVIYTDSLIAEIAKSKAPGFADAVRAASKKAENGFEVNPELIEKISAEFATTQEMYAVEIQRAFSDSNCQGCGN